MCTSLEVFKSIENMGSFQMSVQNGAVLITWLSLYKYLLIKRLKSYHGNANDRKYGYPCSF